MAVELEVIYRDKKFREAMAKAPELGVKHMRRTFALVLQRFQGRVSKERMRGRPHLNRRTGALVRSQKVIVKGDKLSRLVGLYTIGGKAAPYARIHQYGTVGAGGTMPDITPKRGKYLVFQPSGSVRRADAAAGGPRLLAAGDSGERLVFATKVAIPPRLRLFELWKADANRRRDTLREGAMRFIGEVARRSGGRR